MGQLQFPQKKEINGPWILNQDDFEKLNDVVEKIDKLLTDSLVQEVKQEIFTEQNNKKLTEEELNNKVEKKIGGSTYQYINKESEIKLVSADDTVLKDQTIKSLLKDSALNNLRPREIRIELNQGYNNRFTLSISNRYGGELDYDINCFDSSISDEIKYELERWLEKRNPSKVLQLWSVYGLFFTLPLILSLVFLFSSIFFKSLTPYKDVIIQESNKILNEGIDSTNRDIALELLLKSETGYVPENFIATKKSSNPVYPKLLVINVILLIFAAIRPMTTIGLAKRKIQYTFYRYWIKVVTVTIPTILVVVPLWNKIVDWLY